MNFVLFVSFLLCCGSVFAEECCEAEAKGCGPVELANGRKGCALQPGLFPIEPCHRWEFGVAAVYWRPYIEGTEYGWTYTGTIGDPSLPIESHLLRVKPSLSWGFEADVGYLFCNDEWKADLAFTFHQGGGSSSFTDNWGQYIVPSTAYTEGILNGSDVTSFANAEARVDSDFYRLSLLLSRSTFVSRLLSVTPGFGLTATLLDIHQTNKFADPDYHVFMEKKHSNAWDIGPSSLMETKLWFGDSGFSLMNDWDLTLGFGQTDVEQRCVYSVSPGANHTIAKDSGIRFSPKVHMLMGLQYEADYWNHTQHLTLMAGLDTYVMWAGNRTIRAINTEVAQFEEKDASTFALIGLTVAGNYQF